MQRTPSTASWREPPATPTKSSPLLAGLLHLLSMVAPRAAPATVPFAEREWTRRGRLAGALLLAFIVIELGALVQYLIVDNDHPLMVMTLAVTVALSLLTAALNHAGRPSIAGLLLVALADLPLAGIPATALGGKLDVIDLGPLYLAAGSLLVAASVLEPASVFAVAAVNCALMALLVVAMPHTAALDGLLASNNAQQAIAGPLLMQAVVALVAFFWARSVLVALRRADRAEEIAALERREVERTHDLEQGVRELLATHVQLANGNFQARVQPIRSPLLWQIGGSLNTLIARLARLAQVDFLLRRTAHEAQRLAEAIQVMRAGGKPVWPAPSGTPLDEVIGALSGVDTSVTPLGETTSPAAPTEAQVPQWPFG